MKTQKSKKQKKSAVKSNKAARKLPPKKSAKKPVKAIAAPKKSPAKIKTSTLQLGAWVKPITEAKYWAERIGQVKSLAPRSPKFPKVYRILFQYLATGKKLPRTEEFDFPITRLSLVPDFRAKVVKQAEPAALKVHEDISDFDILEEIDPTQPMSLPEVIKAKAVSAPAPSAVEEEPEPPQAPLKNGGIALIKVFCSEGPWDGMTMTTAAGNKQFSPNPGIPGMYVNMDSTDPVSGLPLFMFDASAVRK